MICFLKILFGWIYSYSYQSILLLDIGKEINLTLAPDSVSSSLIIHLKENNHSCKFCTQSINLVANSGNLVAENQVASILCIKILSVVHDLRSKSVVSSLLKVYAVLEGAKDIELCSNSAANFSNCSCHQA